VGRKAEADERFGRRVASIVERDDEGLCGGWASGGDWR